MCLVCIGMKFTVLEYKLKNAPNALFVLVGLNSYAPTDVIG